MNKPNSVIFISNPFGFGPTGKTIALIEELWRLWKGQIIYSASQMCQETIPMRIKNSILIETINERDAESLKSLFIKYPNSLVVCTLNKRAIKTAKEMGLPAVFIDSLCWLWNEVPRDYLAADTYYCFNIFGVKDKLPKQKNIKFIPPILGELPKGSHKKDGLILIHIGGFKNPFQDKMSYSYLNLLLEALSQNSFGKEIIVSGGSEAIDYMEKNFEGRNVRFQTLRRDEFVKYLNNASRFVTTSGLTATLEAFALKTPTSFIPPTNLSQWKILKLLVKQGCAESKIEWDDVLNYETDFDLLSEKDAIPEFHKMAEQVYEDMTARANFSRLVSNLLTKPVDAQKQTDFISSLGTSGSRIIAEDLLLQLA